MSSFIAIGAATLADIYDPAERRKMMGIFYAAPLLSPSLSLLLGGILTQAFNWHATFWLLAAILGIKIILFTFFFHDTFCCECSLMYQCALARRGRAIIFPRLEANAMSITMPIAMLAVVGTTESKEEADLGDGSVSPSSGSTAIGDDMQAGITLSLADVKLFLPLLLIL
jgi:MFS family permease